MPVVVLRGTVVVRFVVVEVVFVVTPVIGFAIGTAGVIGGVFVTLACVCYLTYCAFGVKTAKA